MGTRFWATREALVHVRHHEAIIETNGDGTVRTRAVDIVRQIPWPAPFTGRIRQNAFTRRWHGREDALEQLASVEGPRYRQAALEGDPENAGVWFGEAAGLIHSVDAAGDVISRIATEAEACLQRVR